MHEESRRQSGPSAEEREMRDMRRRLAQLERWAELVESRERMMISKKMATALQMPKQSQSEDQFWVRCCVDGISFHTVECAFALPLYDRA